jgi:N-acetylneuraminic acid mutarotase
MGLNNYLKPGPSIRQSPLFTRFLLLAVLFTGSVLQDQLNAQSLDWTQSKPLPEPRADYAAGIVGGKLVIAGGTYWEGRKGHWIKKHFSASTHSFDPVKQTWDRLPDIPTTLGGMASAVVGGKLFVLGGFTGTAINQKIYTLERTRDGYAWKILGNMPVDRVFAMAASVGRFLYLLGGAAQFEPMDAAGTCCTSKTATSTLMVLDTTQRERGWRQLAPFPGALRWYFTIETDGEFIWMFGGRYQAKPSDLLINFNQVLRYRISADRWEGMKPLPEINPNGVPPSPVLVKDKIILVSDQKVVWQLDLEKLDYTELSPLPEATFVDKFAWLGGQIIGAGGENTLEGPRRRSDWTFIGRFR